MADSKPLRRIRSFVRRSGRMTEAQQKAYHSLWPQYGWRREQGMLSSAQLAAFPQWVLEIGFGMGQSLAEMAQQSPDTGYIGIEVHQAGVGKLLHSIAAADLQNVFIYQDDAVEVLEACIPDQSLDRIQIFFPDPWHKKKHHKRRLIQPQFVAQLRRKLKAGGVLHLATDWEHYAEQMMEVMSAAPGFVNLAEPYCFSERPDYRPVTKFERRGQRLGHGVWDILFRRC